MAPTFSHLLIAAFCAYHLVTGLVLVGPTRLTRAVAARFYGMQLPEELDARYEFANKALGVYSIHIAFLGALGLWIGGTALTAILCSFLVLSLLRVLERWHYRHLLATAFGLPVERTVTKTGLNFFLVALLAAAIMIK